jgi:hypothetical protein
MSESGNSRSDTHRRRNADRDAATLEIFLSRGVFVRLWCTKTVECLTFQAPALHTVCLRFRHLDIEPLRPIR